jgi:hypothetical protein
VPADVLARAQIAPKRGRKIVHKCSTCVRQPWRNNRCRLLKRLGCQMCDSCRLA